MCGTENGAEYKPKVIPFNFLIRKMLECQTSKQRTGKVIS